MWWRWAPFLTGDWCATGAALLSWLLWVVDGVFAGGGLGIGVMRAWRWCGSGNGVRLVGVSGGLPPATPLVRPRYLGGLPG